jgi:toxin ParE1/3/4
LNKWTIRLSKEAERQFDNIIFYSLETWGAERAAKTRLMLTDAFDVISRHPGIGELELRRSGEYRRKFVDPHFIYYRMESDYVEVVRIIHQREAPTTKF